MHEKSLTESFVMTRMSVPLGLRRRLDWKKVRSNQKVAAVLGLCVNPKVRKYTSDLTQWVTFSYIVFCATSLSVPLAYHVHYLNLNISFFPRTKSSGSLTCLTSLHDISTP